MMSRTWMSTAILGVMLSSSALSYGQAASQPASQPAGGGSFISLAELQKYFSEKAEKLRRALEQEQMAALEQFIKVAPASERKATLQALIEGALSLDRNAQAVSWADEYLKDSKGGEEAWEVHRMRFSALMELGKDEQARAEWDALTAKVDNGTAEWQQMFTCAIIIADGMIDAGKINEVRELYKLMKTRFGFVSNLATVMGPREDALRWLGKAPPKIEGKDMEGKEIDLAQYKGKVVLIDFWATWCQPCLMAMPELMETYKQYNKSGFEIIGISLDQDKNALDGFLKAKPIPWRIVFDGKAWYGANPRNFEVTAIPATFLLNREGKVVMVGAPTGGMGPAVARLLEAKAK